MRIRRGILMLMVCLNLFTIPVYARSIKSLVFIGVVLEVERDEKGNETSLLVDGFIKEQEVYKEKIIGKITPETKIYSSDTEKKDKVSIESGDMVYMRVSNAMTKSIPPQTNIIRVFVSKAK